MKKLLIALFIMVSGGFVLSNQDVQAKTKLAPWSQEKTSENSEAKPTELKLNAEHEVYYKYSGFHYAAQKKMWKKAITNWNRLGVVKIVPDRHDNKAMTINLHVDSPQDNAKGDLSETDSQDVDGLTVNQFNNQNHSVTCYLTGGTFFNSPRINAQIATHELGHALGFAHDSRKLHNRYFIMHADSIHSHEYGLGSYEKRTLQHYYSDQL
ncbi:zinc metalloprotease [Apilactobacillus timberlakei]|uniref:Zn-dependent protease n=1 Tax=Apilactobacillus timberlakei TaxID=2008380 RepID=A0ABY2YSF0_9LACO|nr:hypothetical protein [Apilactobacillus timberlakei]TPR14213.1 hypothetical protein DY048_04500 [Apilactobacillus timberlakei]TPR16466.1 hypothetical protein DY052_02590 [Apilactobacillus timberlakei]TPR19507.1 hypothetical protein DY138_02360 [Apilactobacillus timberlakei]TPR20484.1 hypothetical protein DY061_04000 [Apilactobacillus timberlakei]TPR22528.1 hypothetical protein DY083_03270 [Apilactobacillus timberlakei]